MKILRQVKSNKPINLNVAWIMSAILQIEIMMLFCSNLPMVILSDVFDLAKDHLGLQLIVILNFILNLIEIIYFLFKFLVQKKSEYASSSKYTFLSLVEIKPYIFFVQILNFNIEKIQSTDNTFILSAVIINLIFSTLEVIILQTINISYRFVEKNYIRRKKNSILSWMLIIPIVFALKFYGSIYGSVFLLLRAFTQLYLNFNNFQNEDMRFFEWFFPLVSIQLTFLIFAHFYFSPLIFTNLIILAFTIIFTTYCCSNLSTNLLIRVLKYHLESCQHIMESQNQDILEVNGGQNQINESEMEKILLKLRIMVEIHLNRLQNDTFIENEQLEAGRFDNWWTFYDRFILDHKVYCQNVTCQCSKIEVRKQSENYKIEKRIFLDKIYEVIKKLQVQSPVSVNKLKIIENYFLIELEKKPLKTYYQLMKIGREKLKREETLEVQNLILETKNNFKQFFFKQKVRNTELDLEPLFQFQDKFKKLRFQLNEMVGEYKRFYQIFATNFVQMQILKQKTRLLTKFKKQISKEIDFCLKRFDKILELITFCIVYFRFFDEYTNKLEKIEEKAQFLMESFKNLSKPMKRESVDIFDPQYGAVKIDLVFKVGQIVTITKNLCHALGYTHRQLTGQKVNKLMPSMFAKNHDKFLRNFVEKESLKMLKSKERVECAKHMNKFLFPITMRLKVDYSHSDGFYAVGFIKPIKPRSEFILMNNYGKFQDITEGLYKRLFEKAFGDDILKVKRLCALKLILSLNYSFKDLDENINEVDELNEGIILTSQQENILMLYYNFPGFMKVYKGKKENGPSKGRSSNRSQITNSNEEGSQSLDFSEDISSYETDLKESLKKYFKSVNVSNLYGFRISYRLQNYDTNEFKCKMLQIISFGEEMSGQQLEKSLSQQIRDFAEYMSIPKQQIHQFPILKNPNEAPSNSELSLKISICASKNNNQPKIQSKILVQPEVSFLIDFGGQSDSSFRPDIEEKKKKQIIISSFQQQIHINLNLQFAFTALIFCMASVLFLIIIFSLQLQGNYMKLQQDSLIITNFRMYFSLSLTIQQMFHLYAAYGLPYPPYLVLKKQIIADRMKTLLQNSITCITISWDEYEKMMTIVDSTTGFTQTQSIFSTMQVIYETLLKAKTTGHQIIDNYVVITQKISNLIDAELTEILTQSDFYKLQTHLAIGAYSIILLGLLAVLIGIRKIGLKKEEKIIDLMPFLKANKAKRNADFYERFQEFNKSSENLDMGKIEQLSLNDCDLTGTMMLNQSMQQGFSKQQSGLIQQNREFRLIGVIKNQKSEITVRIIIFGVILSGLCLFVIIYTEYFTYQADDKFSAYIQLKSVSNMVQLIPTRITLLYFINFHRILNNQTITIMPSSFLSHIFNQTFSFQTHISTTTYYGTQIQQLVSKQFSQNICHLISCSNSSINSSIIQNQQLFYLSYRYVTAFDYLRKITNMLPNDTDPKGTMLKWIEQNNVFEILNSIEYVLDLMETTESEISSLFTRQIQQIGYILLSLSLTLIPTLMVFLTFGKKKFMQHAIQKLKCTEDVFKLISWSMLSQNTYALVYFQNKLKKSKI